MRKVNTLNWVIVDYNGQQIIFFKCLTDYFDCDVIIGPYCVLDKVLYRVEHFSNVEKLVFCDNLRNIKNFNWA